MDQAQDSIGHSKPLAIIGTALALGLPMATLLLGRLGVADGISPFKEAIWWGMALVILLWAVQVERQPLAALGFKRPTWGTLGWGLFSGFVLILLIGACYALLFPALGIKTDPKALNTIARQPVWMIFFLALRAGFVEELLFRFYPITRLHWLTGSKWIASLIPATIFIGMHAPSWGLAHLIPVSMAALVLTLLYWKRRDFWCSALAHFLADFIPFTMAAMAMH